MSADSEKKVRVAPPNKNQEEASDSPTPATVVNSSDKCYSPGWTITFQQKVACVLVNVAALFLAFIFLSLFYVPATQLCRYLLVDPFRSYGCVMYEKYYQPVCEMEDVSSLNATFSCTPRQFQDFYQPKDRLFPACPAACGQQLITIVCSTDEKIIVPSYSRIAYLTLRLVIKGIKDCIGSLISLLGVFVHLVLHILLMTVTMGFWVFLLTKFMDITQGSSNGFKKPAFLKKAAAEGNKPGRWGPMSTIYFWILYGCNKAWDKVVEMSSAGTVTDDIVTLDDYKGASEAKKELELIISFLKDPARWHRLGATIPLGVLLYGPPGTGKTLFARCLAGEAGAHFIQTSASEFQTMFVGSGVKKLKAIFAEARKNSPSIIFIDELDAVSKRSSGSICPYANQTMNHLLFEMDGFVKYSSNIVIVAATNRLEAIDKALMRPGRFETVIHVDFPDLPARAEILQQYVDKKLKQTGELDVAAIASKTEGFSGAELSNLVNRAAIIATLQDAEKVQQEHLQQAVEDTITKLQSIKNASANSSCPDAATTIAQIFNQLYKDH